jgi:hypothetical protein
LTPGSVRRVHVRLLPWRPRWRLRDIPEGSLDVGGFDVGDDPISLVIGLFLLLLGLPAVIFVVLGVLLFSVEIGLLLALLPLVMLGQRIGWLPWYLAVTSTTGERQWICAGNTREMLSARRYYRSLRPH